MTSREAGPAFFLYETVGIVIKQPNIGGLAPVTFQFQWAVNVSRHFAQGHRCRCNRKYDYHKAKLSTPAKEVSSFKGKQKCNGEPGAKGEKGNFGAVVENQTKGFPGFRNRPRPESLIKDHILYGYVEIAVMEPPQQGQY